MTALLTSLPGDIPGLLRRGSPVLYRSARHVLEDVAETYAVIGTRTGLWNLRGEDVALDLTDSTARWQAAVWAKWEAGNQGGPVWSAEEQQAFARAIHDEMMSPTEIDTLARLVLRLAGRTP